MGKAISEYFYNFTERNLPADQVAEYVNYTQNNFYFCLAALKNERIEKLRAHFSQTGVKRIFVSATLSCFDFHLAGWDVEYLEKDYFQCDDQLSHKAAYLEDSIVIVNNNDIAPVGSNSHYSAFYASCDKTIFVAWDFDNHHRMARSIFLATHSDLYVPAHHENLYLLTRYNWLTTEPVYAGTIQWSRKFLADHLHEMLTVERSNAPLGMHVLYPVFHFRIQVISSLSQHYSSIGFSDHTYHNRSSEDRFKEWCQHKSHWIVPILNDIPIRICDALVTGGIPIVPESLRFLPPVNDICREHIVFYTPQDIIHPQKIVAAANELFDKGGTDKMVERHVYALNHHHSNVKMLQILKYVSEAFALNLRIRNW